MRNSVEQVFASDKSIGATGASDAWPPEPRSWARRPAVAAARDFAWAAAAASSIESGKARAETS
jgi:hypothetical protein